MQTILSLFHSKTELYYVIFILLMGSSFTYTLLCIPVWIAERANKIWSPQIRYYTVFYTVFAWVIFSNTWASNQNKFITKAILYAPLVGLTITYLGFIVKGYSRSKTLTYGWYLIMPPLCGFLLTRI